MNQCIKILFATVAVCIFIGAIQPCSAGAKLRIEKNIRDLFLTEPNDTFGKLIHVRRYSRAFSILNYGAGTTDEQIFSRALLATYASGKFSKAIELCEEWLLANTTADRSSRGLVFEVIGLCHINLRADQKAVEAFTNAITIAPTRSAFYGRATALERLQNQENSSKDWWRGAFRVKNKGNSLQEFFGLEAEAPILEIPLSQSFPGMLKLEDWQKAIQIADAAEELENKGEFQKASMFYREAAESYPLDASIWNALAVCLMSANGSYSDTEVAFQKALSLAPSDWRIKNNFGLFKFMNYKDDAGSILLEVFETKEISEFQKAKLGAAIGICEIRKDKEYPKHWVLSSAERRRVDDNKAK